VRATRSYTRARVCVCVCVCVCVYAEDGYKLFCIKFRMKSEPRVAAAGFVLECAWFSR